MPDGEGARARAVASHGSRADAPFGAVSSATVEFCGSNNDGPSTFALQGIWSDGVCGRNIDDRRGDRFHKVENAPVAGDLYCSCGFESDLQLALSCNRRTVLVRTACASGATVNVLHACCHDLRPRDHADLSHRPCLRAFDGEIDSPPEAWLRFQCDGPTTGAHCTNARGLRWVGQLYSDGRGGGHEDGSAGTIRASSSTASVAPLSRVNGG